MEAATPLSMAGIQADKEPAARGVRDVGAAAGDERRQLKHKTTSQLADSARNRTRSIA